MVERPAVVVERPDSGRGERIRDRFRRRRRHAGPPSSCESAYAIRRARHPRPTRRGTTGTSNARSGRRPRWPCSARRRPPRARLATTGSGRCAACRQPADAEVGAERAQLRRRLDPTLGRDQEVALRRGRKLGRRPVVVGGRALLGRGRRHMPSSRDDCRGRRTRDRRAAEPERSASTPAISAPGRPSASMPIACCPRRAPPRRSSSCTTRGSSTRATPTRPGGSTYPREDRAFGSGVLRFLAPGLALTLDDLAWLMIIVSDNAGDAHVARRGRRCGCGERHHGRGSASAPHA